MQNRQSFSFSDNQCTKILPIMLAIMLMLLATYYAPNYAGIIGAGLLQTNFAWPCYNRVFVLYTAHPMLVQSQVQLHY